jgi:hypothetical protein
MPSGAIVKPWDKQVVHSLSEVDAATLREGWPQSRPPAKLFLTTRSPLARLA